MLDSDDLPILPIGLAIGVVVILVVLITLGLLCSLLGLLGNQQTITAGLIGLALAGFGS
jgi:cell division protein FtsX